jgi:hypothetical protein
VCRTLSAISTTCRLIAALMPASRFIMICALESGFLAASVLGPPVALVLKMRPVPLPAVVLYAAALSAPYP